MPACTVGALLRTAVTLACVWESAWPREIRPNGYGDDGWEWIKSLGLSASDIDWGEHPVWAALRVRQKEIGYLVPRTAVHDCAIKYTNPLWVYNWDPHVRTSVNLDTVSGPGPTCKPWPALGIKAWRCETETLVDAEPPRPWMSCIGGFWGEEPELFCVAAGGSA